MAGIDDIPKILVSHLFKSFGTQVVLDDINLAVRKGGTVVVLGRSGAGKSVLLKILVGIQKPDSGSIWIDEEEITEANLKVLNQVRKKIGFLFQYSALYDSLTVEENVKFPLRRHTEMLETELKERVFELLARVEMAGTSSKLPSEISGGMRKRVALARALALNPDILLCDEPTAGLDPITSAEINELIRRMQEEQALTSIVVTHDLQSARKISTAVALLHQGKILMQGTFDDLVRSENPLIHQFMKPVA
jgi:phospholipid/cholesterol/gamma-HCH transport system ATP-binding protein